MGKSQGKYGVYSEEDRLSLLREFKMSGMGKHSFCKLHGIKSTSNPKILGKEVQIWKRFVTFAARNRRNGYGKPKQGQFQGRECAAKEAHPWTGEVTLTEKGCHF